jgi:glutamyl-tRNA reductase
MEIGCMVISHKKANVEEIERVWSEKRDEIAAKIISNPHISEFAYIFTCNRFEIYVAGRDVESYLRSLSSQLDIEEIVEVKIGDRCLEHLLRVTSGLESMMIGEEQVLGQVRRYYNQCRDAGMTGEVLDRIFSKAIQVGRRVRRVTRISRGSVSIGSAAVELAEKKLGSLRGKKVLLVGAGEMGTLVAKAIANKDVKAVLIANRTFSKAKELAEKIGGIAVRFDSLDKYLRECDIVISATSAPHTVISRESVEKAMRHRKKLILIDIALPRDVDETVREIEGVELLTIDDLRTISENNLKKRLSEVVKAEEIIREELKQLKLLLKDIRAARAIAMMYSAAEKYKREEIEELYSKLVSRYGVDEKVKILLEDFANSLIKKFLRMPTVRLREAARDGRPYVIDAVTFLFDDERDRHVSEEEIEETEKREPERVIQGG